MRFDLLGMVARRPPIPGAVLALAFRDLLTIQGPPSPLEVGQRQMHEWHAWFTNKGFRMIVEAAGRDWGEGAVFADDLWFPTWRA